MVRWIEIQDESYSPFMASSHLKVVKIFYHGIWFCFWLYALICCKHEFHVLFCFLLGNPDLAATRFLVKTAFLLGDDVSFSRQGKNLKIFVVSVKLTQLLLLVSFYFVKSGCGLQLCTLRRWCIFRN